MWRMFAQVSCGAGDETVPQQGPNPGTGSRAVGPLPCSPAVHFRGCVLVALSDGHKIPPFLIPKETDIMSMCNISACSAVPAPEGARGSLLGALGRCHLTPSCANSFSSMLCGQNTTLLDRSLQCLQLH